MAVNAVVTFTDYKKLIDAMRQVNPELVKALRKKYRTIGKDVVTGIKDKIPSEAPLSGMVTKIGRLSWSRTEGQKRDIKSVVVRDKKRRPRSTYPIVGLVQVVVRAAPVGLADMAGRSNRHIDSRDETLPYNYTYTGKYGGKYVAKRTHKIRGQGRIMIARLDSKASRYAYPGAEKSLPQAKAEVMAAINDAVNNVNQMLRRA